MADEVEAVVAMKVYYFSTERPLRSGVVAGKIVRVVSVGGRVAYFFEADQIIPEYGSNILLLCPKQIGDIWIPNSDIPLFCYVVRGEKLLRISEICSDDVSGKIVDWGAISDGKTAQRWADSPFTLDPAPGSNGCEA